MCMAAQRWASIGENIYATSIDKLRAYGWTQIMISSRKVDRESLEGGLTPPTIIIAGVIPEEVDPYFSYQFNATAPCPQGCSRAGGDCVEER